MKAHLMYRDRDFDPAAKPPPEESDLIQDLELDTLLAAMAGGDEFLADVAHKAILHSLTDPDEIIYRQDILRDCLAHEPVIREIYDIAVAAIAAERHIYRSSIGRSPDLTLHRSVQVLEIFMDTLRRLRAIADEQATGFASEGFRTFFTMVSTELDDDYLAGVDDHLRRLQFRDGVLISAQLGKGNKGIHYVLRKPAQVRTSLLDRLTTRNRNYYTLTIPDRDESGARALSDLKGRGIGLVASAMARSTDHILAFLTMLRTELGFYVGCLNLAAKLAERDEPTCFPTPEPAAQRALSASGMYDVCLALRLEHRVVANNLSANQRSLIMVTGANQGGKSTFLRSVGLAQLMTQAGMFAPAESLTSSVCSGLFTHYKREEDTTMTSGKLDEELSRMSTIADHITTDGMLLCNESFAATNEREGSQISADIIHALHEAGIRIVFVTHLYDLAERIYDQRTDSELFLRAERQPDGRRTYKLIEGAPLPTSYGADLYRQIFQTHS